MTCRGLILAELSSSQHLKRTSRLAVRGGPVESQNCHKIIRSQKLGGEEEPEEASREQTELHEGGV